MRDRTYFYEFQKKKRACVDLPKYKEALEKAEVNLSIAKQERGFTAGEKVKVAEERVKQLKDYIAYLDKLLSS
jgi:hypothetical protein